jgi:hypothetical protein
MKGVRVNWRRWRQLHSKKFTNSFDFIGGVTRNLGNERIIRGKRRNSLNLIGGVGRNSCRGVEGNMYRGVSINFAKKSKKTQY